MRNHQHDQTRRIRRLAVAGCFLVAGVLGTAVGISALSTDDDPAPAGAVPSPPAPVIGRREDEAARWSGGAADRARLEVCTANPISADALEHCIEGGR